MEEVSNTRALPRERKSSILCQMMWTAVFLRRLSVPQIGSHRMVVWDSARTFVLVLKTISLDVLCYLASCFGVLKEVPDLLFEEVFPDVDCGHGNNHDVSHRNQDEEYRLLKTGDRSQVHNIEARVRHSTSREEESIDITQIEGLLGVVRVAIGSAPIKNDRG